jgi:hypothetical protein
LNGAAYLALCRSDYETALSLGRQALVIGLELRIDHTSRAWPLIQLAAAQLAVRDFASATNTMAEIACAHPERDPTIRGELEVLAVKRALFKEGPRRVVIESEPRRLVGLPATVLGEYQGLLAIAFAASGQTGPAQAAAATSESCPQMIESHFYPRFARLIARAVEEGGISDVQAGAISLLAEAEAAQFHGFIRDRVSRLSASSGPRHERRERSAGCRPPCSGCARQCACGCVWLRSLWREDDCLAHYA